MRRARIAVIALTVLAAIVAGAACGDDAGQGRGQAPSTSTTAVPETTTSVPATTTTTGERDLSEASRLRLDGIGPIQIGMTVAEASAAVGRTVAVHPNSLLHGADSLCGFAEVSRGPADLLFMVLRDDPAAEWRIYRVDVHESSRIATGGGIRIGATEDEVKQVYGDELQVEPHEYTGPEGHYLVLDADGAGGYMLLFETDGTRVLQFRSGNDEAVRHVEGCA
ncbi:MAG TPA: hypothetical protein VGL92_10540 [Acidimicrobiia bacterium]